MECKGYRGFSFFDELHVTYIDPSVDATSNTFKFEVEGKFYIVNASSVLRNELGVIEETTPTNILAKLAGLTKAQVSNIEANANNEVSSFRYVAEPADKTAAKPVIDAINALATSTDLVTDVPAARALYAGLSSTEQENLVPASVLAKLVKEEAKLAVASAKAALTDAAILNVNDADVDNVTDDLTLPTPSDVTITWTSSNTNYVATTGVVTQPTFTVGDKVVTWTATIVSDDDATVKDTKVWTLTVKKAAITATEEIQLAKTALEIGYKAGDSRTSVTDDLTLTTTGTNGTTVAWASSNAVVIDPATGVVTPATADTEVTLTATITKAGGTTATKVFIVTVKGN